MDKNLYLLVFDRDLATDYNQLHENIKNDPNILDWWHYITSSYLLVSQLSVNDLANKIINYFPNHRFLLIKVDPHTSQGWLPKDAWEWLTKYKNKLPY